MKFSAFVPLLFFAFGMANAGIIIRPRVEVDSAYDNGLKISEARQKDIDSVEPYLNGPDTYWARGVEVRLSPFPAGYSPSGSSFGHFQARQESTLEV
ncbi:hypothetical protein EV421DRAFT_1849848 [Armillaria borealis]|uniref:Uncharacterized protein n=1 Tax=Armillaria borealis TaxID=47425 RepID=A0AA39MFX0_9AGAR|nr:hypothetical protein EV421DRAFT_1849848 [Armillaria borealis]